MKIDILDKKAKTLSAVEVPTQFTLKSNPKLITQAVQYELAKTIVPGGHVKSRAEVRGGGRKPWRQKGTGRARVGSNRSPLWRSGGVTFRVKTSFRKQIPAKMHIKAIFITVSQKLKDKKLIILKDLKLQKIQTKLFVEILKNLKIEDKKILLVVSEIDQNLLKSVQNLPNISLVYPRQLEVRYIISSDYIILDNHSFENLKEWGKSIKD
ncbi:MAG: 50S ribosomal protein L4 [bacterium]